MRIVAWIKGTRGVACLDAMLAAGEGITLVVLQNQPDTDWFAEASRLARENDLPVLPLEDPNCDESKASLAKHPADLFVLAGYGKIIGPGIISMPRVMSINLHGGMLPQQRGSSPMNWALITGQKEFGISIIQVDQGVDTGPVLAKRTFPVGPNDTIADLHALANEAFPKMLLEVLASLRQGTLRPEPQSEQGAAYWPARFPDDGLVLFDRLNADQVHGMIRALTDPYPGAYTYFSGRKVKLLSSRLKKVDFFGTPGRVYQVKNGSLLICAKDKCLWIDRAEFEDDGSALAETIARYDRLATVSGILESFLIEKKEL